ncbi:MAG: hypothetical protein IPG93_01440 [Burkholderiales bacterium]|nr:hypothetical protein [Burkholderiales bacterium]
MVDSTHSNLVRRRQFALGKTACSEFIDPVLTAIGDRWIVTSHRELEVTQVTEADRSITLIGFALDGNQPAASNHDLLQQLLAHGGPVSGLIAQTSTWGGRWAVIAHSSDSSLIWNDATAQRPVYYALPAIGQSGDGLVCAAEPGLLAHSHKFQKSAAAVDFVRSREVSDFEVYWMPGDVTVYDEVRALLPNHCLDLRSGAVRRFWPTSAVAPVDYDTAVAESVRLLRGQLEAAQRRFKLSISMTAGWDSRMMLALCKPAVGDLHAFTLAYPNQPRDTRDVAVPARLLARLGMKHDIYDYPRVIDESLRDIIRSNNDSVAKGYCADTQAIFEQHPTERVCVTGDVAEIVKCHWRLPGRTDRDVTAEELMGLLKIGNHPFLLDAMRRWLQQAGTPAISLCDLFCWEQMAGRWQSQIRAEYDVAQDSFAPLNCRSLLVLMLGVAEDKRRSPEFVFFRDVIQALWPETLAEPINPPEVQSLSRRLRHAVAKSGITQVIPRSVKDAIKRRRG